MNNIKTYERLVKKANQPLYGESFRMPNLNKVSQLLDELGIENHLTSWSCMKYTSPAGFRYYTSGGTREYNGFRLRIPEIHLDINSTDTYYSWNTKQYAQELIKLIDLKTK